MAIGVRLGDPTGGTLKKYFDNDFALEFNFGMPTYLIGGYDYENYYNDKYKKNGYYGYGYKSKFRYDLQLHFTKLFDIKSVDGLQWYAGGGLQFRQQFLEYTYYDYYGKPYTENASVAQFGLDVVGGAEYTFSNVPFSLFADVTTFVNFINGAGVYFQPGVGGRYNF